MRRLRPMNRLWIPALVAAASLPAAAASAQGPLFGAGEQGSQNMKVVSHVPMGGPFYANDLEIEQELSRPYVYVSRRSMFGFSIVDIEDPDNPEEIFEWEIENAELHAGRALDAKYFKVDGRYYVVISFQFQPSGPDADLGAVVFDVTGLPDVSQVREVARIRAPDTPGGFHNIFAYKHSDGSALLFATTSGDHAKVYDLERVVRADADAPVARIPTPPAPTGGSGYHDFYVSFDPNAQQDKFYGGGAGGYYVFDVTEVENPELLVSLTGIAGIERGHTFTPTPDGRYVIAEVEYQYAPLRIFDLAPGLSGDTPVISRPIGAWTARYKGLPHNHEVRWPYVFVSAYEDGVQVFNMMDPTNPYTVGYFHTYDGPLEINKDSPMEKAEPGRGAVTNGSFGIDVRNADGLIVSADMYTGLWILKMDGFSGWNGEDWGMPNVSSAQDWDNGPENVLRPVT